MGAASCEELLISNIDGNVLFPETEDFEKARTSVWNLDTAGNPSVIIKSTSTNDVVQAIKFANHTTSSGFAFTQSALTPVSQ